jgi:molybdopterin synthase sulfur carrier subunit
VKVKVLFFAALRENVGVASEEVDLPGETSTVAALRAHLAGRGGAWTSALAEKSCCALQSTRTWFPPATAIRAGDEVAFFPPVTGG